MATLPLFTLLFIKLLNERAPNLASSKGRKARLGLGHKLFSIPEATQFYISHSKYARSSSNTVLRNLAFFSVRYFIVFALGGIKDFILQERRWKGVNEMTGNEITRLVKWLKEKGYELNEILELLEYITNSKN